MSFLYQFLMIFGFISNISFGFITTRRLVILVALFIIIFNWKRVIELSSLIKPSMRKSGTLLLVCLLITFFHAVTVVQSPMNQYFGPRDIVTLVMGILVMGLWSAVEIKSFEKFAIIIVVFVLLQSLFTYISAVNQPFRIYVAEHFMDESYVNRSQQVIYGMGGRAAGIGLAWSMGSLVLAYGCLILIALRMRSRINPFLFGLFYAIILGATALMGRTGMLVEVVLLLFYGLYGGQLKNMFFLVFIAVIGLIILNQVLSRYDELMAEVTREWMFQFMDSDKVGDINEQVSGGGLPPFSSDFIFGTGIILGKYNGLTFDADSGYVRSYTSIGIIGMFCYYVGLLLLLIGPIKKTITRNQRMLMWVGIIILFLVEYKEPYIGMTIYPWILFTMALLLYRDSKKEKNENNSSGRLLSM